MTDSAQVTQDIVFRMMESNHNLVSNWLIWSSVVVVLFGIIGALFQFYLNSRKVSNEVEKHIRESKLKFEAELENKVSSLKSEASESLLITSNELKQELSKELDSVRGELTAIIVQSHTVQSMQWFNEGRIQESYLSVETCIFFAAYYEDETLDIVLAHALRIMDKAKLDGITLKRIHLGIEKLSSLEVKSEAVKQFLDRNKSLPV